MAALRLVLMMTLHVMQVDNAIVKITLVVKNVMSVLMDIGIFHIVNVSV